MAKQPADSRKQKLSSVSAAVLRLRLLHTQNPARKDQMTMQQNYFSGWALPSCY